MNTATQTTRDVSGVNAGDVIGVRYESVHGSPAADHTMVLRVTDAGHNVTATAFGGDDTFVVRTDGPTATELAKEDTFGNARRVGYVADVTRMGWV